MPSLVIYMDASLRTAGLITADHPGMAIRITLADDILEDGLDAFYEVLGATDKARNMITQDLQTRYDATYKVTQDRTNLWRAQVCMQNLDAVRDNPIFRTLLDHGRVAERLVAVYESGVAILRIDLPPDMDYEDAQELAERLRESATLMDRNALVRVGELSQELENWQPLSEYQPPS